MLIERMLKVDAKGRIALGEWAKGVSSFRIREQSDHSFILEPMVEIPLRDKLLLNNNKLSKQAIQETNTGKTHRASSVKALFDEIK